MPPVYCFECGRSGARLDVVRQVDDRDIPPTDEEIAAAKLSPPGPDPVSGLGGFLWERRILPPKVAFGAGWSWDGRGMKGRH